MAAPAHPSSPMLQQALVSSDASVIGYDWHKPFDKSRSGKERVSLLVLIRPQFDPIHTHRHIGQDFRIFETV
jgi:hypothetical protein